LAAQMLWAMRAVPTTPSAQKKHALGDGGR
jgi:hypothetical protein